jgi:hypothetical protein
MTDEDRMAVFKLIAAFDDAMQMFARANVTPEQLGVTETTAQERMRAVVLAIGDARRRWPPPSAAS